PSGGPVSPRTIVTHVSGSIIVITSFPGVFAGLPVFFQSLDVFGLAVKFDEIRAEQIEHRSHLLRIAA
uniref:hypothetical protein n=1 Tax=Megasphaera sp. TaxID=2023260 RepID=UPI0040261BF8